MWKTPHSQISVFFVLFSLVLLQQVFCKIPANKSLLVLITNYSIVNARNYVKDTTLTKQRFVCLVYFHRSYYNKYIVRYLRIKSSLVLITNYSIFYYLKNHTDNALGEVFLLNWVRRLQKLISLLGALLQEFGVRVR